MIPKNLLPDENSLTVFSQLARLDEVDTAELKICRAKIAAARDLNEKFEQITGNLHNGSKDFPEDFAEIDRFSCTFRLLVALTFIPDVEENYRKHGWPAAAAADAMGDFGVWAMHCRKNYGFTGLHKWGLLSWLRNHTNGNLIQLGRLQYNLNSTDRHPAAFYRNRKTGKLLAIAPAGNFFNKDGYIAESMTAGGWETTLEETAVSVTGHPIFPDGRGCRMVCTLDLAIWEKVLQQGDPVINFHIPETGPLTIEKCAGSFAMAAEFFNNVCPEYPWKAFHVETWFCDPQLAAWLPENSNIRKFQSCGYLLPETAPSDAIARVFPGREPSAEGNSLQKTLYRMISSGVTFHRGTMILLKEDLPFRENCYRNQKLDFMEICDILP